MRRILLIVVAAGIAAVAWWLASPLLLDRRVDEAFPMAASATVPNNMTRGEVEQVMATMAKMGELADEPMPESGAAPVALASGTFRDADAFHRGSGTATVYRLADGTAVLRFEGFSVTNGPDLRVLLAGHTNPADHDDLEAQGYVELDKLKGNIGNQNYVIPATVDPEARQSVVIYCRPFHVVFSVATLAPVM